MDKVPNPAQWLLRLWDRLPGTNTTASLQVWATVFGMNPGDSRLLSALPAMVEMANRARDAVLRLGFPDDITSDLVEWRGAYDKVLPYAASNIGWNSIRPEFSDIRRDRLQHCAKWLSKVCASAEETQGELDRIAQELQGLRDTISAAQDIDEEFRKLLLDVVECMRRAIVEYELHGATGVDAALGEILGMVLRRAKSNGEQSESAKSLFKKTFGVLKDFASIGGMIRTGNDLLTAAGNFLGHF